MPFIKFYMVLIFFTAMTAFAAENSKKVHCKDSVIFYSLEPFYIANQGKAYKVHLQNVRCSNSQVAGLEVMHITQPVSMNEVPDIHSALANYNRSPDNMSLSGNIVSARWPQTLEVENPDLSRQKFIKLIRLTFSGDFQPTENINWIDLQDITFNKPNNILLHNMK